MPHIGSYLGEGGDDAPALDFMAGRRTATDIANIKDTKANDTSRNIAQSYFSYTLTNQLPRLTNPERDACRILDDAGTLSLKPKLA